MTAEAKPSRFGPNHTPPLDYSFDTLKQAFRPPTVSRLTAYAKRTGVDESAVVPTILASYPEKGVRQLASEVGTTIRTMQDLFDFYGKPRLSWEEMDALNKSAKKGIYGIATEERRAIGTRSAQKTMREGLGIHSPTRTKGDRQAAGRKGGLITGPITAERGTGLFALTAEEKRSAGARGGTRAHALGVGAFGVDSATGEKLNVIGGRRTYARGAGAHARTHEQHLADGLRASEALSSRKIIVESDYFDSYLEAATAASLERFIPGYQLQRGENYQVVVEEAGKKVDFMVNNVLVEYNPIVLKYLQGRVTGFDTQEEYELYMQSLSQLDRTQQFAYTAQVREGIAQRYFQRRREAIDQDPAYQERELIVATTPADLYDAVITRFGENYPNRDEFVDFFNSTTRALKNENRRRRKREGQEVS